MSDNKNPYVAIAVPIVFFLLSAWLIYSIAREDYHWQPSLLEHRISDTTSGFQVLWEKTNVFSLANDREIYLAVVDENVIFAGSLNENDWPSLISLDTLTGQEQWRVDTSPQSFANDAQFIYIGISWNQIAAYEITSGDVVWSESLRDARNFTHLIADGEMLHVGSATSNYYRLDKSTGAVDQIIKTTFDFFIEDGIIYTTAPFMTAKHENSDNIIWQTDLGNPVAINPVLTDNFIILKTQFGGWPIGQGHILDRQTGVILWETEPDSVISNLAISDEIVYYLTENAKLHAVDIYTGDKLDAVSFESKITEADLVNRNFMVAADEGIVVIYMGDSQQMFSLKFDPSLAE